MVETNRRKRADYAKEGNIFLNFDENARVMRLGGYTALEDCLSMVCRKIGRITNLRDREPQNESVHDSFLDLAVYAVLLLGIHNREAQSESPYPNLLQTVADLDLDLDLDLDHARGERLGLDLTPTYPAEAQRGPGGKLPR